MTEQIVLRGILNDRRVYDAFRNYGDSESLSPIGRLLVRFAGEYYGADANVQRCDDAVIVERSARELSNTKHAEALRRAVADLPEDSSGGNCIRDILDLKRRAVGSKLAIALANNAPLNEVSKLIEEYKTVPDGATEGAASVEVVDIFDTEDLVKEKEHPEQLIHLWPKELNNRVDGGARRGHHVLVYARPEMGKTLFTINMCCGFLQQKLNVLYVGNEEPPEDLRMRFRMRLLKKSKQTIRNHPEKALEAMGKLDPGKLKIAPLTPGSFNEIHNLMTKLKPDVLVLDQLRNLNVGEDSRTGQLERAANSARATGKRFNALVVSITQAGMSASGKVYLGLDDVDGSKTGIPAAVDLMIGVGGSADMQATGLMGLSTAKNKLSGLHDNFTVSYDPKTGVFLD